MYLVAIFTVQFPWKQFLVVNCYDSTLFPSQLSKNQYRKVSPKCKSIDLIRNSTHIFNLLCRKNWHQQKIIHFSVPWWIRTSVAVVGIDKTLFPLDKKQLKVSLLETDTDDTFYLQISQHFHTHRNPRKRKTMFKVRNKTPAWNQNFAVKIACCESLFAAWRANKKFRVIYIWKIYEPFLGFSQNSRCWCFMAWKHSLHLFCPLFLAQWTKFTWFMMKI